MGNPFCKQGHGFLSVFALISFKPPLCLCLCKCLTFIGTFLHVLLIFNTAGMSLLGTEFEMCMGTSFHYSTQRKELQVFSND